MTQSTPTDPARVLEIERLKRQTEEWRIDQLTKPSIFDRLRGQGSVVKGGFVMAVKHSEDLKRAMTAALGDTGKGVPFDALQFCQDFDGRPKVTVFKDGKPIMDIWVRPDETLRFDAAGFIAAHVSDA